MQRLHREIARDAARIAGAPLAQLLIIRRREGVIVGETLAVEGLALQALPLRARAFELLTRAPGHAPAAALLEPSSPPREVAPCEPELADLVWQGVEPGGSALHSIFLRLTHHATEAKVLRLLLPGRQRGAALRALDALARLSAGRLEAESFRREIAGRDAVYRVFQEGAGEAIFIVDATTGQVLEGNQRSCELTGRTRVELRRFTAGQLLEHPTLDGEGLLRRLGSAPVVREDEARLRRRRGEPVPVSLTASQIEIDGSPVLHVIARDVTRERQALAELRQARDTLAALHLAGAHLMVETDEAGMFGVLARELGRLGFHCGILAPALDGTSWLTWRHLSFPLPLRSALERALGRSLTDVRVDPLDAPLVRKCLVERRTVHTDQARRVAQELVGGASDRQLRRLYRLVKIRRIILAPLRREGRPVAVLAVGAPRLRKGDPEAIEAFALQASIALEKARLFSALREERARLESEVARRTAELTRAVKALEEADRQKDNFLANISHELRTPLVTVLGYADLLLGEKLGELAPRQRTALQVVVQSGRRLRHFIDELIELSRHELTQESYAFAALDLRDVFSQVVLSLAPRFAERGLLLRTRVPRGTPRVWADRERLLQVLVNLLVNAERYSPDGACVRVAAAEVAPGRIEVSVTDHGSGISEEHLGHIFDRLYQVRDDLGAKGGALGIGLAIVKAVVDAHGGQLTVRSLVGRGTRFRFSLRAAPATPATVAAPTPVADPPQRPVGSKS
jgi:PAS domain S-box-containing protein